MSFNSDVAPSGNEEEEENFAIWQEPRKEPLGAPKENLMNEDNSFDPLPDDRLHVLEEQHEMLSSSLFSLSSHLAQIEFRLRQIVKAPTEEKDAMLKALEDFTAKGVPQARAAPQGSAEYTACHECAELEQKISRQRSKQSHFIEKLKSQLKELEKFSSVPYTDKSSSVSKHKLLIDHLKKEIDHNLEENCQPLTADELRHQINCAIRQYADRQISKDEIICKLQAHIDDMQKFVKLMKNEEFKNHKEFSADGTASFKAETNFERMHQSNKSNDDLKTETVNLMRKASTLIQIFTVSQFGCSPNTNKVYERKSSSSTISTHWGNIRAKLEMSIESVLSIVSRDRPTNPLVDSYDSESEEGGVIINDVPLTTAVRRHLSTNLRDLLHHGLITPESNTLVPIIGCFPVRRPSYFKSTRHFWEVIMKYYTINNGDAFNSTPARKLSQSFNLDIVGGTTISNRQGLLSAIGGILASHAPYKRSYDAHFKAFVCTGLNAHKLVIWLNIILKCKSLIDLYYSTNSYVVNTGFQDALQSLDRLTPYNFDLPVDLAVKQFQNIKDVFN